MRHAPTGGTERYLNHLAQYLCEQGHDVTIVCRSHRQAPHPRVRFVKLRSFALGPAWRRWAFARAVERHLQAHAYDVVLGLGKTWSQDVIRLGGGCHQTFLDAMADQGLTRPRLNDRVALAIERRAFHNPGCRRIIANAHMVKRDVLARYGLDPARIAVIHNGVDLDRFHPRVRTGEGRALRQAIGFNDEDCVFLFLGNGFSRKGLDLVLEAFPPVLRTFPQARLLIVGKDSRQSVYEARAASLGLGAAVKFLGPRADAERCFGAADLYVLPTRYDPFANTTLEAMACGLPVITSDTNGGSELIRPGVYGEVISLRDGADGLSTHLQAWCNRERLRAASAAARAEAEQHGIESKMRAALDILQAVRDEKRARAATTAAGP
jgi:UDP-glucose:(heptosyl)LPS alpha-1,3-glucosyltransferase